MAQIPKPRNLNLAGAQNRGSQIWSKIDPFWAILGPPILRPSQEAPRNLWGNGPKWPKRAKKGSQIWPKIGHFGPYLAYIWPLGGQMGQKGPFWPFWPKWPNMAKRGPKTAYFDYIWPRRAQNGQNGQKGPKWPFWPFSCQMAQNGPFWPI